jgi:hypothetical protein
VLSYTARAQVGGKLAQLGSRLVDGTAKMMADQFFSAFSARVGAGPVVAPVLDEAAPIAPTVVETVRFTPTEPAGLSAAEEHEVQGIIDPDGGATEANERALDHALGTAEDVERRVEEQVETAAIKSGPSGPMVWGLIALAAVVVVLLISSL